MARGIPGDWPEFRDPCGLMDVNSGSVLLLFQGDPFLKSRWFRVRTETHAANWLCRYRCFLPHNLPCPGIVAPIAVTLTAVCVQCRELPNRPPATHRGSCDHLKKSTGEIRGNFEISRRLLAMDGQVSSGDAHRLFCLAANSTPVRKVHVQRRNNRHESTRRSAEKIEAGRSRPAATHRLA